MASPQDNISGSYTDQFVTRIWTFDLHALTEQNQAWLSCYQSTRSSSEAGQKQSSRNGWSNRGKSLFTDLPELAPLQRQCMQVFRHVLKALHSDEFPPLDLEAWFNVTDPGGANVEHTHPRVLLSGVYYLQVPDNSGDIIFSDPRPAAVHNLARYTAKQMTSVYKCTPKAGQLIIFPAWLGHRVEQNNSDLPRVSIAMNAKLAK